MGACKSAERVSNARSRHPPNPHSARLALIKKEAS
jgi:hypothetical protein